MNRPPRSRRLLGWVLVPVVVVGLIGAVAQMIRANETGNTLVGGFEIDGNYFEGFDNDTTPGNPINVQGDDWGTPAVEADTTHVVDGRASADTTVLDGGHEADPLNVWNDSPAGPAAPGASDIHNVWGYDQVAGGDVFAYFAWNRVAIQGQVVWFVELNQEPNTTNVNGVSVPNRSVGDLRFTLNGNQANLQITAIDQWNGPSDLNVPPEQFWEPLAQGTIAGLVNDSAISVPDGTLVEDGSLDTLGTALFTEFGANLSELWGESCGFGDYIELNLRSTAGGAGAQLKDYLHTPIEIVSRCGELTIVKNDEDDLPVGGATFTITPNPIPGQPADPPLTITDNDENDDDPTDGVIRIPAVEPGTYTVTETGTPPGYISDPDPQTVTVEEFGDATITFANTLGSISWEKRDADTGDLICCATFSVVGTGGAAANEPWNIDITVTDNDGLMDADPAVGQIIVADLPTGTYTVTETEPPAGYGPADPPDRTGVVVTADAPDAEITTDFQNPQILTDLSVLKEDNDSGAPLEGAVFQLYLDADGVQPGDEPDPADTPVGEDCTTGPDGLCTVSGLNFGNYFWYEVAVPPGFELPIDRTSSLITVNAQNAGMAQTYNFSNPRLPGATQVEKLDESDGTPLEGGRFDLVFDENENAVYEPGVDPVSGSCTTRLPNGTCTIEDLDFGTYWWVETVPPTGYELPENPVSDPVVINAGNVGEIQVRTFLDPRSSSELPVQKLDASDDAPLEGAVFDLVIDDGDGEYDPDLDTEVAGSCTTVLPNGTCSVDGLDFGTYFWVETSPPIGYSLPPNPVSDPIVIDATNAGTERSVTTFRDPRLLSALAVEKLDATSGEPLADGVFALFLDRDGDGEDGVTDDTPDLDDRPIIDKCVTNDTGTCTVSDLDFGTYYWFEVSAPPGYDLSADRTSDMIVIDASTPESEIQVYTFEDPQILSQLTVRKVDEENMDPLDGAEFDLVLDSNENGVYNPGVDEVVGSCITGETGDGTCSVGDLNFGTYFWVETSPPTGYQLPDPAFSEPIVIDATNAGSPFLLPLITFEDPRLLTNLSLLKVDGPSGNPVDGAVFQLYQDDGDGIADPDVDTPVGEECTTGDDGPGLCTAMDLNFGDYFWFEMSPPPGYDPPENPTSDIVTIDANNAGQQLTIEFSNPRILSELTVLKLDAMSEEPVDGGVFELYLDFDGDGEDGVTDDAPDPDDTLVGTCTTGEDPEADPGTCTIGDRDFGTYYWFELTPPEGYGPSPDRTSEMIVIDPSNAGTDIPATEFENPRLPVMLLITKVDEAEELLPGATFEVDPDPTDGEGTLTVIDGGASDLDGEENGVIELETVLFESGPFTVTETEAPPGYIPDPTPQDWAPMVGSEAATLTFENSLGSISWEKVDAITGDPICCATFTMLATDGAAAEDPWNIDITVTDNGEGDADPDDGQVTIANLPTGTYTVTETVPPAGYLLPDEPAVTDNVISEETPNPTLADPFEDPLVSVSWGKIDAVTDEMICCATFSVVATGGPAAEDPWNIEVTVTDNGEGDADPVAGQVTVANLPTGTYTVTETIPPPGYELPQPPSQESTISGETPNPTLTDPFADPQRLTNFSVLKVDAENGDPLDGAVFQLYLDDGDGMANPDVDEPVGEECTTGDDGPGLCTAMDLNFGDYFWFEVAPAPGFEVPDNRTSPIVTMGPANAGQEQRVQFTNPRTLSELTVEKLDAEDGAPLAGAEFDLVLDTNGNDEYEEGVDTVVGSCISDATGTCSIGELDFGTYWWVEIAAPPGFPIPDNPVSDPITLDAASAGNPTTFTFSNPRLLSELTVEKLDAETEAPLAGGQFDLVIDNGDGMYEEGVDQLVGSCTTDATGTCSIGDRDFGTYFWVETGAPPGYLLPDDPVSDPIVIDASNAGTAVPPFTFLDQPVIEPTWTVMKTADPESDVELEPGDVITYIVTASELSGGPILDAVVTDDLSAVLEHASFVTGSIETSTGTASLVGTTLTWNVPSLSGDETMTYQVRIDSGAFGVTISNHATGEGAESCETVVAQQPSSCDSTTHQTAEEPPPTTLTTTTEPSTTSTQPTTTTTTTQPTTTTTEPPDEDPDDELPFTGAPVFWLLLSGTLFVGGGAGLVSWAKRLGASRPAPE